MHPVGPPAVLGTVRKDCPNRNFLFLQANIRSVRQGVGDTDVPQLLLVAEEQGPHVGYVPVGILVIVQLPLDEWPQRQGDRV